MYVTHDLAVAGSICHTIAVLYGGMIQEIGPTKEVLSEAKHPYTEGLINSIPSKSKTEGPLLAINGFFKWQDIDGICPFAPRCPLVRHECKRGVPALRRVGSRLVRCLNYGDVYED
jgi:oligopeptide/dipeptide ABC transporter ATP-binding protein